MPNQRPYNFRAGNQEGLNLARGEAHRHYTGRLISAKAGIVICSIDASEQEIGILRKHERTGCPVGEDVLLDSSNCYWVVH